MKASLRDHWPQVSAAIQVGSPLLWGALCAAATRQGALGGWWSSVPLLLLFPLLWARGATIPGPAAWAVPLACWAAAALSVRTLRRSLHAACLFATGASTAAVQLWQLLR